MKVQESDSHWKVMVFMDEYEMPSTSKDAMVTPPSHSRPRLIRGERKKSISTFVSFSSGLSMHYFAICRGPRRPRCIIGYIASGFSFFVARFSTIIRRDFTRWIAFWNNRIYPHFENRTCYSLILRGETRVFFDEKYQARSESSI